MLTTTRIDEADLERLRIHSKRNRRSMTQQLGMFIPEAEGDDTVYIHNTMDSVMSFDGTLETPPNVQTVTMPTDLKQAAATLNAMPGYHKQADLANKKVKPLVKGKK